MLVSMTKGVGDGTDIKTHDDLLRALSYQVGKQARGIVGGSLAQDHHHHGETKYHQRNHPAGDSTQ